MVFGHSSACKRPPGPEIKSATHSGSTQGGPNGHCQHACPAALQNTPAKAFDAGGVLYEPLYHMALHGSAGSQVLGDVSGKRVGLGILLFRSNMQERRRSF